MRLCRQKFRGYPQFLLGTYCITRFWCLYGVALIDRRYNKEGNFNIVFTSNKHPSHWRGNFNEDDALLCALDRIFDDATVFTIKGESFRGKKLETVALQTSRVKAPDSSEKPTP